MKIEGTGDEIAQKALRITQLAIGYTNENIPVSLVEGQNLLTMNETDLKKWVKEHLSDNAIKAFSEINITTPDAIANYIWEKTTQMRENNPPIKGASNRGYMPQTDKAPEWQSNLQKGLVNVRY